MPPNINNTYLCLIPKIKSLEKAKDFHPISLCNVIYKLISKTIANRLKKCLPKLVTESQSAFMSNHLITNNILVAFKTLHHLKNRRRGKTGSTTMSHRYPCVLEVSGAQYMSDTNTVAQMKCPCPCFLEHIY